MVKPKPVLEKDFQNTLVAYANLKGYVVAHFTTCQVRPGKFITAAKYQGAGFPDLILSKKGRQTLFVECKTDRGVVSDKQQIWLDLLGGHVVRPKDFDEFKKLL